MDLMREIKRRMMLMIGRAVIRALKSDGGRVLVTIDMLDGETSGEVELAEPWGMTSIPMAGAEAATLAVMGERGQKIAISMGDRAVRPRDGVPGETILFDEQGQRIAIKRDGIAVSTPFKLTVVAPEISIVADSATINGRAIATVGHTVNVQGGSSAGQHPIVTGVGDDG